METKREIIIDSKSNHNNEEDNNYAVTARRARIFVYKNSKAEENDCFAYTQRRYNDVKVNINIHINALKDCKCCNIHQSNRNLDLDNNFKEEDEYKEEKKCKCNCRYLIRQYLRLEEYIDCFYNDVQDYIDFIKNRRYTPGYEDVTFNSWTNYNWDEREDT